MKFVGFDGEGSIWHEVILDYYIDEVGFRSGMQLSLSWRAFGNWWCIIIIVDDCGVACMYYWYRVIIIVNDGMFSLWCSWGCIGGQDGLSLASQIPHMDCFLVNVSVTKACRRWWAWLVGNLFAKEDMGHRFDCLELVRGCFLDAFYGRGEVVGCLEDAICGHYFRNRNDMVFITVVGQLYSVQYKGIFGTPDQGQTLYV
jgi:hypothetical protein